MQIKTLGGYVKGAITYVSDSSALRPLHFRGAHPDEMCLTESLMPVAMGVITMRFIAENSFRSQSANLRTVARRR